MLRFDLDAWMNGTADVSAGLQSQKQANVRILQQSVKYYMSAGVIMGTEEKLGIIKKIINGRIQREIDGGERSILLIQDRHLLKRQRRDG